MLVALKGCARVELCTRLVSELLSNRGGLNPCFVRPGLLFEPKDQPACLKTYARLAIFEYASSFGARSSKVSVPSFSCSRRRCAARYLLLYARLDLQNTQQQTRLRPNLSAHHADAAASAVLALSNGRFSLTKADSTELIGSGHVGPQTASSLLRFPAPACCFTASRACFCFVTDASCCCRYGS